MRKNEYMQAQKLIFFVLIVIFSNFNMISLTSTPCSSSPCLYEGECKDILNGTDFRCKCRANRHGKHCELEAIESRCEFKERRALDGRLVTICLNGGTCFRTNLEPTIDKCHCPSGYFGKQCELLSKIKIHNPDKTPKFHFLDDYCNSTFQGRCKNNGTCVNNGEFDYRCICARGWAGEDCTFRTMYEPEQLKPNSRNINAPVRIFGKSVVNRTGPIRGRAIENETMGDEDFCQTLWSKSCENGGVCVTGTKDDFQCECTLEWSGKTCSLAVVINACSSDPCLHGGFCIIMKDASFTCDCPLEFLGKFCAEINPCIKGSVECKFGSTCVRKNDKDFQCKCRMPYKGEHCDEEDLCLIDNGECVDDLLPKPKCFPCGIDESCQKISSDKYSCDYLNKSSPQQMLHPSEKKIGIYHENEDVASDMSVDGPNMVIPAIVLLALILYLFILAIVLTVDRFNRTRPRLIIVGDVRRIAVDTFYILTVETGHDSFAGTAAKIYCEIFGDLSKTNVLILNNYLITGMRQNDEINFLINTPRPLGNILKVQLWLDTDDKSNAGFRPSWYCRKIIVRDIKTEEIWFFFVKKWLCFEVGESIAVEANVATAVEVQNVYGIKLRWEDIVHQLREHHMWICTFTCPSNSEHTRAERLTVVMALFLCYMFFTMVLYGVSEDSIHHRIKYHHPVVLHTYSPVFSIGTKASLIGFVFGWFFGIIFRFIRRQLIPALIVWDDAETLRNKVENKRDTMQQTESINFPQEYKSIEVDARPTLFRIPSTDIFQTQKWISQIHVDTRRVLKNISQGKPYQDRYIHSYTLSSSGKAICQSKLSDSLRRQGRPCCRKHKRCMKPNVEIGMNFGQRIQKQQCRGFSQREYLSVARLSFLTEALADAAPEPIVIVQKKRSGKLFQIRTNSLNKNPNVKRQLTSDERKLKENSSGSRTSLTPGVTFEGTGDTLPLSGKEFTKRQESLSRNISTNTSTVAIPTGDIERPWKLELCNIEHSIHFHHCLPYNFVWVAWGISVSAILMFSILLIYYGLQFSWHKSMNWLASICWALIESFFMFQPIKVLITYLIVIYKQRIYHDRNPFEFDIKLRFKLLWVSGPALPIVIWPLYYLIHPLAFNGEYEIDPAKFVFPFPIKPMAFQLNQSKVEAPVIIETETNTDDVVGVPHDPEKISQQQLKPRNGTKWLHSTRRRVSNQIQKLDSVRSLKSQSQQT